jgi:hypothetical protein
MQTGILTVTGEGKTELPLRGWPREVIVFFKPDHDPVPCDPHHHHHHNDHLSYHVEHEDEDRREHQKPGHHHHDRKFFLEIKWKVSSVREIEWIVFY